MSCETYEIATEKTLLLVLAELVAVHEILEGVLDNDRDAIKTRLDDVPQTIIE